MIGGIICHSDSAVPYHELNEQRSDLGIWKG